MIDRENKRILNKIKKDFPKISKMTYLELGIFLGKILGKTPDWVSLGEAHDYLGGYKNEDRDRKIKDEIVKLREND